MIHPTESPPIPKLLEALESGGLSDTSTLLYEHIILDGQIYDPIFGPISHILLEPKHDDLVHRLLDEIEHRENLALKQEVAFRFVLEKEVIHPDFFSFLQRHEIHLDDEQITAALNAISLNKSFPLDKLIQQIPFFSVLNRLSSLAILSADEILKGTASFHFQLFKQELEKFGDALSLNDFSKLSLLASNTATQRNESLPPKDAQDLVLNHFINLIEETILPT